MQTPWPASSRLRGQGLGWAFLMSSRPCHSMIGELETSLR